MFQMTNSKPVATPIEQELYLPPLNQDSPDTKLRLQYQTAFGSLMYAMLQTQQNIAYSISKLSQYSSNSQEPH